MFIRKHFLISGLMMAALVPFPVLAQNAGAGNAATANSAGTSAGANPGTAAINNNNAGTNHGSSANEAAAGEIQIVPVQNLINRPLVDPQGHDAGKINRVVINTANGALDFVIVAGNGDFNLNGNVVALPWEAIATPIAAQGPIKISIAAARLQKAPLLNPGAVASLETSNARAGVYGYYGYRYAPYGVGYGYGWAPGVLGGRNAYPGGAGNIYANNNGGRFNGNAGNYGNTAGANFNNRAGYGNSAGMNAANRRGNGEMSNGEMNRANRGAVNGFGGNVASGQGANNPAANGGAYNTAANNVSAGQVGPSGQQMVRRGLVIDASGVVQTLLSPNTTSANALKAASVYAPNGHVVGQVQHVLIDPKRGEVAFALIKEGGFLGLAPHWFAIPVQALAWTPFRGGYRLTTSARLLANEPTIPVQTKLPTEVPAMQLAQLYQHFGLRPYWEEGSGQNGQGMANAGAGNAGDANAR